MKIGTQAKQQNTTKQAWIFEEHDTIIMKIVGRLNKKNKKISS